MPDEDTSLVHGNFAAVFDGVTLEHVSPYPDPSPARQAADLASRIAYELYDKSRYRNERLIHRMFAEADKAIHAFNRGLGITTKTVNYLDKQYAAAVGAIGFIEGDMLYYGHLLDSGVLVLDEHFKPVVEAVFDTDLYDDYVESIEEQKHLEKGSEKEYVYIRKNLVNNSHASVHHKQIGFGVLTGEPEANSFVRSGSVQLRPGYTVVIYTDGFIPYLHRRDFVRRLALDTADDIRKFIRQLEGTSHELTFERTLVCYRI